jgi:hypothetical protein
VHEIEVRLSLPRFPWDERKLVAERLLHLRGARRA